MDISWPCFSSMWAAIQIRLTTLVIIPWSKHFFFFFAICFWLFREIDLFFSSEKVVLFFPSWMVDFCTLDNYIDQYIFFTWRFMCFLFSISVSHLDLPVWLSAFSHRGFLVMMTELILNEAKLWPKSAPRWLKKEFVYLCF